MASAGLTAESPESFSKSHMASLFRLTMTLTLKIK